VRFSREGFGARLSDLPVIVARRGGRIVAYLITSSIQAQAWTSCSGMTTNSRLSGVSDVDIEGVAADSGYELIGGPANALVALKYVTKFPPPGIPDASTGQLKLVKQNTYAGLGIGRKDLFCGEYFGEYKNPPAGTWTLQVWYDDRMLLEKSFTVGKP
jgi:hypothetical protein